MSSNVGLSTPRGSGTSGYVQRSLSHLKPRDGPYPARDSPDAHHPAPRQPDAAILEHDRRRAIEAQVFELRDGLEEAGVAEEEVEARCDALRAKLSKESAGGARAAGRLKGYQTHEIARAKGVEDERLRRALGIGKDYEEGGHWKRQEERARVGGGAADEGGSRAGAGVAKGAAGARAAGYRDLDRPGRRESGSKERSRSPPRRSRPRSRSSSGSRSDRS